jgi:SHS2 domain-containing protein
VIEQIDHTADIGLRVRAATPAEAFELVAGGMFDFIVTNRDTVELELDEELQVEADGWEDLLVAWLEELLYRFETDRFVPKVIAIRQIEHDLLVADLQGGTFDAARHETGVQIKAVTYHQLRAELTADGFQIQVIFDI